ncbi:heparan-alpha-glucosaminide N-acetyltransferase domain-containing protein, partial [Acinetobacter baumannii]
MGLGVGSRNRAGAAVAEFHRKLEHLPELDGLRGIAILMVMSFHFLWFAEGFGLFRISPAPLPQWLVALQ